MLIDTLEKLNHARAQKRPVVLLTYLNDGAQTLYFRDGSYAGREPTNEIKSLSVRSLDTDCCQLTEDETVFVQPFNPPLRMIIVGAVHITQSLAEMARYCGYQVIVVDPRQAFAATARFPAVELVTDWPDKALQELAPDTRTAVITLSHDPKLDDPALNLALNSNAFYIGALGSRKTQLARHKRLTENGFTETQLARVHGPVGLDIGAQSPAEIAVAIMAQVTESLHRGNA